METNPNVDVVQGAYAALDADDLPRFLEFFAADATVRYPASGQIRYGGEWHGHEGIGQFLETHDEIEEILEFEAVAMVAEADSVFVRGFFRGRSKVTGRPWETRWVHAFEVDGGRIKRWEAFFDTAAAIAAHAD